MGQHITARQPAGGHEAGVPRPHGLRDKRTKQCGQGRDEEDLDNEDQACSPWQHTDDLPQGDVTSLQAHTGAHDQSEGGKSGQHRESQGHPAHGRVGLLRVAAGSHPGDY